MRSLIQIRCDAIVSRCVELLALLGGVVIAAIALTTTWSIIGRNFLNKPLLGDVEIASVGMALAVACFMPICQWRGANIIVEFFTLKASKAAQRRLDAIGALAMCLMMTLFAWRTFSGAAAAARAQTTTMLLELPEWIAYAVLVPPFILTAGVAMYMALFGAPSHAAGPITATSDRQEH